jgi:hypothetical protein
MKKRQGIKTQIFNAWKDCIEKDYCSQRINSERSLQASLWFHLYQKMPLNRRLFIEPPIKIHKSDGRNNVYPDIVICNTREVISVIELKYIPRGKPRYKKDIETLSFISRHRNKLSIANSRFRGQEKDNKQYTFSKNILFVWAGVHFHDQSENYELFSKGKRTLYGSYLQLHAATTFDDSPSVFFLE